MNHDNFDPSPSWIQRWRERNAIVFKRQHGEKKDHDCEAAEHWITSVWTSIQDRYSASEIITVTKQAFIIISFQKAQCVSKMKNFSVERNQKNV